jgi:(Z)-2-((N-methylformamido)methylene)-5-hydroxybutyrolactone dehydrogenase
MERFEHQIDGRNAPPTGGEFLPSYDPVTARPWAEIARGTPADVDRAVASAQRAFGEWRRTSPAVRAELLWRLGDLIAEHAEELARLESRDIGKVIREMRGQMQGLPRWYRYFAGQTRDLEGSVKMVVNDDGKGGRTAAREILHRHYPMRLPGHEKQTSQRSSGS